MNGSVKDFFGKFHIGTYYFQKNARSEAGVKDLSDCGIDLVFGIDNDKDVLDLFAKYGVSAVVGGIVPGWFGGHGENAGTMCTTNKREDYVKGLNSFVDHPAIVGIDAGDEPSSLDFPYYGQMIELMKELAPSKFPYLNIYPSYAMLASNDEAQTEKELGVPTYKEYIDAYGKNIDLPYLSFDHYVFSSNNKDRLFSDLNTTAEYCRDNGKQLYVVLQVNSLREEEHVSEDQLLFQAFSAMAHGAKAVSWACYSAGWWYHNVLDSEGNKTEQYEKLKSANAKIRALGNVCFDYNWSSTVRVKGGSKTDLCAFSDVAFTSDALIGSFNKENGVNAIFISPVEYDSKGANTLTFKAEKADKVILHVAEGKRELTPDQTGLYRVELNGAEPCFITAE